MHADSQVESRHTSFLSQEWALVSWRFRANCRGRKTGDRRALESPNYSDNPLDSQQTSLPTKFRKISMKNTLRAGYLRAERAPERSTRVLAGGGIRDGSRLVLRIVASSGGRGDRRSEAGAGEAAPAWASLSWRLARMPALRYSKSEEIVHVKPWQKTHEEATTPQSLTKRRVCQAPSHRFG